MKNILSLDISQKATGVAFGNNKGYLNKEAITPVNTLSLVNKDVPTLDDSGNKITFKGGKRKGQVRTTKKPFTHLERLNIITTSIADMLMSKKYNISILLIEKNRTSGSGTNPDNIERTMEIQGAIKYFAINVPNLEIVMIAKSIWFQVVPTDYYVWKNVNGKSNKVDEKESAVNYAKYLLLKENVSKNIIDNLDDNGADAYLMYKYYVSLLKGVKYEKK